MTPASSPRPRILVVDDEFVIAKTLAVILNQNGFDARATCDADEALHLAAECHPDILLCDVVLPGHNGFELASQILAGLPQCRIFILSAQSWGCDIAGDSLLRHSYFEMLAKPIDPTVLLARLRASLCIPFPARR